jgi:hypothetical protein
MNLLDMFKTKTLMRFLFFLTIFSLIFLPAILIQYAHHDDYVFLDGAPSFRHGEHEILMSIGRWTGAVIVDINQVMFRNFYDFSFMRGLSVFLISVCAMMFFKWIRASFQRDIDAFLFVVLVFSLPPFEVLVQWACALYIVIGFFLAMRAAEHTDRALVSSGPHQRRHLWMSWMCLVLAISTYQNAGMFYWTMGMFKFVFDDKYRKNLWSHCFVFLRTCFLALIFYAVSLKFFEKNANNVGTYNPYNWTTDYWAKLDWFIREPLYNAVNMWNIFPNREWVIFTATFLGLGFLITMVQLRRDPKHFPGEIKNRLSIMVIVAMFFLLTYLPNLMSKIPAPFYRTAFGLTTIIMFVWLWIIRRFLSLAPQNIRSAIFTTILFVALIIGGQECFKNVWLYRVLPSRMEWDYVTQMFQKNDLSRFDKIGVIQPVATPFDRYDEFGVFTTFYNQDIKRLLTCAMRDVGKAKVSSGLLENLFVIMPGEESYIDATTLVLDIHKPQMQYLYALMSYKKNGFFSAI